MENQYFTSPLIAEALASRLREPDGPEVVLISTEHSPSYFDQATMDRTRFDFVSHLRAADHPERFCAYSPVTTLGRTIIVHAKLTIIDEALLRIGSANINNRSMGFDTECDLALEVTNDAQGARLAQMRTHLLAHWLGCADDVVQKALEESRGSVVAALETLRNSGYTRLRPIKPGKMNPVSAAVATYHVGDPVAATDAWKPWRRRGALRSVLSRYDLAPDQVSMVPGR